MENKKSSVPKLRFPGFTGAWEQRKLGEVVERFDNLRIPVTSSKRKRGITPYYGANGIQDYVQGYTHDGEFVLVAEDGANDLQNYPIHYVNGKVWVNNHAHVLQGKKDIADNLFLVNAIKRIKFETYLVGGSRAKLNADVMMKLPIKIPKLNEQQKLGKYFSRIDSLIALHQRKLEHLKEQKKGLLQKMFPKNGEVVPEVRFPGFTDDWEQRKFEEFATYSGKKNKANLDLEPYAITSNEGFIKQNEAHNEFGYMKNTDRSAYNIVQPNSFGYNPARINIGSIGYYSGNSDIIVSSLYEVFKTNADIDDQFLSVWFKSSRFKEWINKLQEGSVRLYFYYDKLSETKIKIPSFTEQKHIGYFFNQLDFLIALHQRKLEHLKLMKKGLLQQMFV